LLQLPRLAAPQAALQARLRGAHLGSEGAPSAQAEGGMIATLEFHHSVPRCLLGLFDRANEGDLDPAGLQAWFEWEEEAFRYRVDPDVSREELDLLIEASASPVPSSAHWSGHSRGGDFARWGRRGGLRTLSLYGRGWFVLLADRRWEKISAEQLAEFFTALYEGRS